jgi:hypothetical protein
MKMKFCAVSPSLPLLESGESMSALKGAGSSEERVFSKGPVPSDCRRRVQKELVCDGSSGLYMSSSIPKSFPP